MTSSDDIPATLSEAIDQRNSLREVIENMADASVKKDAEIDRLTKALAAANARNKEIANLMMVGRDLVNETADRKDELAGEVKRLTEALAASNADRDRLAQQLGMAQTEARGLRAELNRVSAPHTGYPYGDALE